MFKIPSLLSSRNREKAKMARAHKQRGKRLKLNLEEFTGGRSRNAWQLVLTMTTVSLRVVESCWKVYQRARRDQRILLEILLHPIYEDGSKEIKDQQEVSMVVYVRISGHLFQYASLGWIESSWLSSCWPEQVSGRSNQVDEPLAFPNQYLTSYLL